jgi:sugar/nucleoside kinase (ribokinase family)
LDQRLVEGAHLSGRALPPRLGGGGANTAVALAHAGHDVSLVSAVGGDQAGRELLAQLAATGVSTAAIAQVPGPSTRSIVLVDGAGERTIVNLGRAREAEPPARLLGLACALLYVRGREPDLAPLLAEMNRRCPVVAHVPPVAAGALPAQVLVGSASDLDARFLADPWTAGQVVAGEVLEWVVVTHGAAGARAHGRGGAVLAAEAPKVEPVDSTGAGHGPGAHGGVPLGRREGAHRGLDPDAGGGGGADLTLARLREMVARHRRAG